MQGSFIFDVRIAQSFWLVALAGLRHPFPSRTRPLRAPAAMILRPGARESSAPPASIVAPCTAMRGAGGLFCVCAHSMSVNISAFTLNWRLFFN